MELKSITVFLTLATTLYAIGFFLKIGSTEFLSEKVAMASFLQNNCIDVNFRWPYDRKQIINALFCLVSHFFPSFAFYTFFCFTIFVWSFCENLCLVDIEILAHKIGTVRWKHYQLIAQDFDKSIHEIFVTLSDQSSQKQKKCQKISAFMKQNI